MAVLMTLTLPVASQFEYIYRDVFRFGVCQRFDDGGYIRRNVIRHRNVGKLQKVYKNDIILMNEKHSI